MEKPTYNMAFEHMQGPGSIAYTALAMIRSIATEVMRDYLKGSAQNTQTEADLINCGADYGLASAEYNKKQMQMQAWGSLIQGLASGITTGVMAGMDFANYKSLSEPTNSVDNIDKTIEELDKPGGNPGGGSGSGVSEAEQSKVVEKISESDFGKKDFEELEIERTDSNGNKTQEKIRDSVKDLNPDIKAELKKALERKKAEINKTIKKQEQKGQMIRSLLMSGIAQSLGQIINGSFGIAGAGYAYDKGVYDTAKQAASQNAQVTGKTDSVNTSGANNSYQDILKALSAYETLIGASAVRG